MTFHKGDPVTVAWKGATRYGVVTGDAHTDALPTGAHFVPVFFDDDGTVHNVDTRVVTLGYHDRGGARGRCAAHTSPSDWTARCTCPPHMCPPEEAGR